MHRFCNPRNAVRIRVGAPITRKDMKIGDEIICKVANYKEGIYRVVGHDGTRFIGRRVHKNGKLGQFDTHVEKWMVDTKTDAYNNLIKLLDEAIKIGEDLNRIIAERGVQLDAHFIKLISERQTQMDDELLVTFNEYGEITGRL